MLSLGRLSLLLAILLSLGAVTTAAPVSDHFSYKNATVPDTPVRGRYIVTLKQGLTARDLESHVGWVNQVHKRSLEGSKNGSATAAGVHKTFDHINVYVGEFDDDTVEQIRSRRDVQAVEEDRIWTPSLQVTGTQNFNLTNNPLNITDNPIYREFLAKSPPRPRARRDNFNLTNDPLNITDNPIYREFLAKSPPRSRARRTAGYSGPSTGWPMAMTNETNAPWGLARISHRRRGARDYRYDAPGGNGTYAYMVDTGLNTAHRDFGGRVVFGYNAVANSSDADVQGHGTHTAGIVGGATYGVAKAAALVAVKVFDRGGSPTSVILDGYNWAVSDIRAKGRAGRAVINLSLGGCGASAAFDAAVEAAYRAGVVTVAAAGNQARDVGPSSPARDAFAVVTVAAADAADRQAPYSNFGPAVDVYAPGTDIPSAWIGSDTATNVMSGTSMACPHVTGLVLYLMAKEGLAQPAALAARVKDLATADVLTGVGPGSPNLLAFNGS